MRYYQLLLILPLTHTIFQNNSKNYFYGEKTIGTKIFIDKSMIKLRAQEIWAVALLVTSNLPDADYWTNFEDIQ